MESASATPATEGAANDLIDIALTSTAPLESQSSSSRTTERALPKTKKDSRKGLFGRKRNAAELEAGSSQQTDQNLLQTAGSVENLGSPRKLYGKALPKMRKTSPEVSVTTVESEGRKSFKDTLSTYWNALFNKKPAKDSEESTGSQNSASVETKGAVKNVEDKIKL